MYDECTSNFEDQGSDHTLNYKERLLALSMLPLMCTLELNDVMFFTSCLKNPSSHLFPPMDSFTF